MANSKYNDAVPAIRQALRFMASSPEYIELKQEVASLSKTKHGGFTGNESCLNVLVEWAREHGTDSLKAFWDISDPEHARLFPAARKTHYQGSYMQQRRRRQQLAVDAFEKYERRKLRGSERDQFKKDMQALWMYYRDEFVRDYPPGSGRNEAVSKFWAHVDDLLETTSTGDFKAAQKVLGTDGEQWLSGLTQH
mgnify:CR=1 FL=1